jgi:2-dehydropantoate 2-reductase
MHILVIGLGAVGTLYGAKLAQAGATVSALCRSDYHHVLNNGVHLKSIWGNYHFHPHLTLKNLSNYPYQPHYLLITTKVLPSINLPKLIKPVVHPHTKIVLLQNGLDIEKPISQAFPKNQIISGLAFVCVTRLAPGLVHHIDYGKLVLGNYPQGLLSATKQLAHLFSSVQVPCQTTRQIIKARFEKLVWNAPFNPISVLSNGVDTQAMLSSKIMTKTIQQIMQEICLIAQACGYQLPQNIIQNKIHQTKKMKPYKTSMLIDHLEKRPLEVEAILGNAYRLAQKHNLSVPHLETLYALLSLV